MLHLHRLEHHEARARGHDIARPDRHRHDHAVHRRRHERDTLLHLAEIDRGFVRRRLLARRSGRNDGPLLGRGGQQRGQVLGHERRVEATDLDGREIENAQEQRNVGRDAADMELAQRLRDIVQRAFVGAPAHDHLGEQGIITQAGRVAGIAIAVDAHMRSGRRRIGGQAARARDRRAVGQQLLQVHPGLDGETFNRRRHRQPDIGEARTEGDANLRLDEIDAGHLLGDGVLHLQARIGLDEPELVATHQEFESAEAGIANLGGELHRDGEDALAQCRGERRRGRDLDELLVAALHRAVAFPEMADVAGAVADHLHLDMAGCGQQLLDIEIAIAEGLARFRTAAREGLVDLLQVLDGPHAAAAAAGNGLEHHGAMRGGKAPRLLQRRRPAGSRHHRNGGALGQAPGADLVAEQRQRVAGRTDEDQACRRAACREIRVLTEETVARMDRGSARFTGSGQDRILVEIGGRPLPRQRARLIDITRVQRCRVVGSVDADRAKAKLARRPGDADGDFASVGDQDRRHSNLHGIAQGDRRPKPRHRSRSASGGRRPRRTMPVTTSVTSSADVSLPSRNQRAGERQVWMMVKAIALTLPGTKRPAAMPSSSRAISAFS